MKTMCKQSGKQQGSAYLTLIMVAIIGIFVIIGLKIAPAYMNDKIVMNAMEGVESDKDYPTMSVDKVRSAIMRTLNTNRVEDFDSSNIVLVREAGKDFIDINYETRVPLFYNLEALVKFKHRFDKS